MSEVTEFCEKHRACSEGAKWAAQYKSLAEVWANCERGDWMIWMLRKRGDVSKTTLVKLACEFVEHVLHVYEAKHPNVDRPRKAIEAARAFANDPTDKNKRLADAAYAAAYAYADAAAYAAADAAYERKWQAERIRVAYGAWNVEHAETWPPRSGRVCGH